MSKFDPDRKLVMAKFKTVLGHSLPAGTPLLLAAEPAAAGEIDEAMARRLQNVLAMKRLALSSDEFPWLEPQALAALPMPVLLMSGAATPAVHRAIFTEVCKAMPNAQVSVVAGAGHGVSREQPEVFNQQVLAFLGRV